jgi:hypothetical protein
MMLDRGVNGEGSDGDTTVHRSRKRIPRGTTAFGQTLDELRARYVFHNRDLCDQAPAITMSDIEQISRMSTRLDAIVGMSDDRRHRLIDALATAIVQYISERGRWPKPLPGLDVRIRERLLAAARKDLNSFEDQRLSVDIVNRLMEWTKLPIERIALDVLYEPSATLNDVCLKWRRQVEGDQDGEPGNPEQADSGSNAT